MIEATVERIGAGVDVSLGTFDFMEVDHDGCISLWRNTSPDPDDPEPDVIFRIVSIENHGLRRAIWVTDVRYSDAGDQTGVCDQPWDRLSILPARNER